jgi:hypothetical protein
LMALKGQNITIHESILTVTFLFVLENKKGVHGELKLLL